MDSVSSSSSSDLGSSVGVSTNSSPKATSPVKGKSRVTLAIIGVILVAVIAVLTYVLIGASSSSPTDIRVTNVTDRSFTVSWETDEQVAGAVIYGTDESFLPYVLARSGKDIAYDDRDVSATELQAVADAGKDATALTEKGAVVEEMGKYYMHHVTVSSLDPEQQYYFMVGNGLVFTNGEGVFVDDRFTQSTVNSVTTFAELDTLATPSPSYGKVYVDEDAVTDGVLYMSVVSGSEGTAYPVVSSLLNDEGSWYVDLSNVRTVNGTATATLDENADSEVLYVNAGVSGESDEITIAMTADAPADLITIVPAESNSQSSQLVSSVIAASCTCDCTGSAGNYQDHYCGAKELSTDTVTISGTCYYVRYHCNAITTDGGATCTTPNHLYTEVDMSAPCDGDADTDPVSDPGSACDDPNSAECTAWYAAGNTTSCTGGTCTWGSGTTGSHCANGYISGACPGDAHVRCCKPASTVSDDDDCVTKQAACSTNPYGSACTSWYKDCDGTKSCTYNDGVTKGTCTYGTSGCLFGSEAGHCPGDSNVTCCANQEPFVVPGDNPCRTGDFNRAVTYYDPYTKTSSQKYCCDTAMSDTHDCPCKSEGVFSYGGSCWRCNSAGNPPLAIPCSCTADKVGKINNAGGYCYACAEQGATPQEISCSGRCTADLVGKLVNENGVCTYCPIVGANPEIRACTCTAEITSGGIFEENGNCYRCINVGSNPQSVDCPDPDDSRCGSNPLTDEWLGTNACNAQCTAANETCQTAIDGTPGTPCCHRNISWVPVNGATQTYRLLESAYAEDQQYTVTDSYVITATESGVYSAQIPGIGTVENIILVEGRQYVFFVDTNGNKVMDEDEETIDAGENPINLTVDEDLSVYTLGLKSGFNFVSFSSVPLKTDSCDLIKEMSDMVEGQITMIARFESGAFQTTSYRHDLDSVTGDCFSVVPGRGYVIKSVGDAQISLSGYALTAPAPVGFDVAGWHLIGINGATTSYTAESLIDDVNEDGSVIADNVTQWETGTSRYEGLQKESSEVYGFDFPIETGIGYFVRIASGSGTWTPE